MKKIILQLSALLALSIGTVSAADRLITDFGDTKPYRDLASWGTASANFKALNPVKDAINSSDSVAQFQLNQGWGAFAVQAVSPIFDIYNYSRLQFKVLVTGAGTVTCKVDNNANFSSTITGSFVVGAADVNKWIVCEMSLEGRKEIGYNNLQFSINNLTSNVYIDDVKLLNIPTTQSRVVLYNQPFGSWAGMSYGDATLYSSVNGGGWGSGATVSGKAGTGYSNISSGDYPPSGTSLSVTSDYVGANGLTLADIDINTFKDLQLKFGFGHGFYWANPAIATSRPKISYKYDAATDWTLLNPASAVSSTVWPTADFKMNLVAFDLPNTGSKISLLIEGTSTSHWIDNLSLVGTIPSIGTGVDKKQVNTVLKITNTEIIADDSVLQIDIYALNGTKLLTVNTNQIIINTLNKGVYIVKTYSSSGNGVRKFVR